MDNYNLNPIKKHFPMNHNNEITAHNIVAYKHAIGFNSGINNVIEVIDPARFQSYAGSTQNSINNDDESGKEKAHYVLSIEKSGILMMELKIVTIAHEAEYYGRGHVDTDVTYEFSHHNKFLSKNQINKFIYHKGFIFEKFLLITNKNRYKFNIPSLPFGDNSFITQQATFQYKNHKNLTNLVNKFNNN